MLELSHTCSLHVQYMYYMRCMYYLDHASYGFIHINAQSGNFVIPQDYGVPLSAFTDKPKGDHDVNDLYPGNRRVYQGKKQQLHVWKLLFVSHLLR